MSTWEDLKEKGNQEFKAKNYHSACSLYTDAINLNSEQEVLYANRSTCYKQLGNFRLALIDIDKALSLNQKNLKNLKRKYELLIIIGNFPEAESILLRCINLEPKEYQHKQDLINVRLNISSFNNFLESYVNQDYEKSVKEGEKLILICTGNSEVKEKYMDSLINIGKLKEATTLWQKLQDIERGKDEFIYLICKVFYYEESYDKAKTSLQKLLKKVNDNPKYNKLYSLCSSIEKEKENANVLFKDQKYQEAIDAYTKLVELDPFNSIFNSTIIANRALCYKKLNKNIEALEDMNNSLKLNPNYTKGYIRRAEINMALQDYEKARYDYQKVLELDPCKFFKFR